MRVRNIKGIEEEIQRLAGAAFVSDPFSLRGRWRQTFGNEGPIHIEIGCGKGRFITQMALENPTINYIAIEKVEEVLHKTVLRMEGLTNIRILHTDGNLLQDMFGEGEIDRIYLNFSDPWPKSRHHKRRLTAEGFLKQYRKVLKKDGRICLKTDNPILFEYSLNTMAPLFRLEQVSLDYQPSKELYDVMTEYEEKFRKNGQPIYRLEAVNIHQEAP